MHKNLQIVPYTEEHNCRWCGALFLRRIKKRSPRLANARIRGFKCKTCSKKCARNRNYLNSKNTKIHEANNPLPELQNE